MGHQEGPLPLGSGQTRLEGLLLLEADHESPSPDHRERGVARLHSSLEQLKTEPPNAICFFNIY